MTLSARQQLILFIILAFVVDYLPFVNLPFMWSETFFHEISHGLAAIFTGGEILNITLNFDGSGHCTTLGGTNFIITFAGYLGSALWGLLIYSLASSLSQSSAKIMTGIMLAMLATTLLLWARDSSTIIILAILLLMYTLPLIKVLWFSVKFFIQLVGIFVLLDSIRSPLYLLDGRDLGDGASLAELSWLPELFWIASWIMIATACLYLLWLNSAKKQNPDQLKPEAVA